VTRLRALGPGFDPAIVATIDVKRSGVGAAKRSCAPARPGLRHAASATTSSGDKG
jgi:hypothetical protein